MPFSDADNSCTFVDRAVSFGPSSKIAVENIAEDAEYGLSISFVLDYISNVAEEFGTLSALVTIDVTTCRPHTSMERASFSVTFFPQQAT